MADQRLKIQLTAIDRTQKAFASVKSGLTKVTRALFSFKTAIVGVVGATGLGLLVKSSLDSIDRISKLSRTLGISVEDLRKLELAASLSGVEMETLARGVRTLNKSAVDFTRDGSGTAAKAFETLGITTTDLNENLGDQFKVLELVAERLQDVENSAVRSSIAQDLFGGRASELLLVLEEGAEGLARISDEAQSFGLILSTATARNVEAANDSFNRLGQLFKGLRDTVVGALAPAFEKLATIIKTKVLDAVADAGGIEEFGRNLAKSIISIFEKAVVGIQKFANMVGRQLNNLLDFIRSIADAVGFELSPAFKDLRFNEFKIAGTIFNDLRNSIDDTTSAMERLGMMTDKVEAAQKGLLSGLPQDYQDVASKGIKTLEDSLTAVIMKTQTASEAFRDMARSIISDLVRIGIQQTITQPLGAALFGAAPARAIGGSVQAGQPYMVGERGKELFVPNQSGAIIPNDKMGASGGVVVNQTINLSAGVSQTVRAEVMNMMPQIANAAKGAVIDAKRRGGTFGSAFGA